MRVSRVPQASNNGGRKLIVGRCYNYLPAAGRSEFGLDGVAGGMPVVALLAFTMRQVAYPEVVGRAASGHYAGCGNAAVENSFIGADAMEVSEKGVWYG